MGSKSPIPPETIQKPPLAAALESLSGFFNLNQLSMTDLADDELLPKLEYMADLVSFLPSTQPQDGEHYGGRIAYLHYVSSGCDFYIVSRDPRYEQIEAFGIVDDEVMSVGDTINIKEILRCGGLLDLDWKPQSISQIVLRSSSY